MQSNQSGVRDDFELTVQSIVRDEIRMFSMKAFYQMLLFCVQLYQKCFQDFFMFQRRYTKHTAPAQLSNDGSFLLHALCAKGCSLQRPDRAKTTVLH